LSNFDLISSSRAWMRSACSLGDEKMGIMSSKRMPAEGKSGYCRSDSRSLTLRWESWAGLEEEAADWLPWAPWEEKLCLGGAAVVVGSGLDEGGCEAVDARSTFCVLGPLFSGWP
jgi:hypothetical protein